MSAVLNGSSSRQAVNTSNTPQKYVHNPVPFDAKMLPVYLNSELANLSSALTDILGGQILPILAEMPEKFKEGTLVLFADKIVDKDGKTIIPSAGLYVFFKGVWNGIATNPIVIEE